MELEMNQELLDKLKKMNREELTVYRGAAYKGEKLIDLFGVILFLLSMSIQSMLFVFLAAPVLGILAIIGTGLRDTWKYIDKDLLKNDN
jgi:hypothetical protein